MFNGFDNNNNNRVKIIEVDLNQGIPKSIYEFFGKENVFYQKGDYVICDTVNGYIIGIVENISRLYLEETKANKYVVDIIDAEINNFEKEKSERERLYRLIGELEDYINEKRQSFIKEKLDDLIAREDEDFAKMYEDYQKHKKVIKGFE